MSDEDEPEFQVIEGKRPTPLPTVSNSIRRYLAKIDKQTKKGKVRAMAVGIVMANGDVTAYVVGETMVQRIAAGTMAMKMATPSIQYEDD